MTLTAAGKTKAGWVANLRRFLAKSWPEKVRAAGLRVRRIYPGTPIPVRVSSHLWFFACSNHLGDHVLAGDYEESEHAFVRGFLRPGMVVLDIGANEGFFTLLFARAVGAQGRIVSFEPSQRERRRLRMNLWINLIR